MCLDWHQFFPIIPVESVDGNILWLKKCERRLNQIYSEYDPVWFWEYREVKTDITNQEK